MASWKVSKAHLLLLVSLTVTATVTVNAVPLEDPASQDEYDSEESLRQEFHDAFTDMNIGSTLREVVKRLDLSTLMEEDSWLRNREMAPQNALFCGVCHAGVDEILHEIQIGTPIANITDLMVNLCVELGISNLNFCDSFVDVIQPQLFWILSNTPGLTGNDFCGIYFTSFGCDSNNPDRVWEVPLPNTIKPPVTLPTLPDPASPTLKVLHLSDTHFDPLYLPGSNAVCGEKFYCCREDSGLVELPENAAGYWGDYRACDIPEWTLRALLEDAYVRYPDLDFVLWTGDVVPHNLWTTSRAINLDIIRKTIEIISESLPGVVVYPAIGNHESHPLNAFPQPYIDNEFDISWLYDELQVLWQTWLPANVAADITYSARYSTLVKPGLRLISVNTNYCYSFNWWLVYDSYDPAEGLQWLTVELQAAELAGEKVYIISHIPSGNDDCSKTWSHEYNKILIRYESTVAGIFYGHTHKDHYQVFYDTENSERPAIVGFVAQSQTVYTDLNPGYKVYTIDGNYPGSSYRVLDHDNYIMDLDEINLTNTSRVFQLYNAKAAYNLSDLTPQTLSDLVNTMAQPNSTIFDEFYKNYIKAARPALEKGCNRRCKSDVLCRLVVSDNSNRTRCDQLRTIVEMDLTLD